MLLFAGEYDFTAQYWPLLIVLVTAVWLLSNKYGYGINQVPGPALAPYSNWWRFIQTCKMRTQDIHIDLHKKYGDVVRLGPKVLLFSDPAARETIYAYSNNTFIKSDMYKCQQTNFKGQRVQSMFSTQDEAFHAMLRRCSSHAFAMSTMKSYEPLMNKALSKWLSQTQKLFADTGDVCNFTQWTQFLAFDVIGQISWSKNIGFTDKNEDVGNIIANIYKSNREKIITGSQPLTDYLKDKNPIKFWFARRGWWPLPTDPLIKFARDRMEEREAELKRIEESNGELKPTFGLDFLARFADSQQKHPDFMNEDRILSIQISLVNAGSETTAITMSAIFHFLLLNPRCYAKLVAEIDAAFANGTISDRSDGLVTWPDAQQLPYLDAVVRESWRLHNPVGSCFERVVTEDGVVLSGYPVPKGTVVGCNPWVIHRRTDVYGDDAEQFRPERWLEATQEEQSRMKNMMLHFGGGHRSCIGHNIARMEVFKTIPSFLRHFEYELAVQNEDWTIKTHFLTKQSDFNVRIKARAHSYPQIA